jgi:formate/nitrite transporter FocA (FNT family)
MRFKHYFTRKFNHKTTETSADVMVATLILSGWFVSLVVYLATT